MSKAAGKEAELDRAGLMFFMALCLQAWLPPVNFQGLWGVTDHNQSKTKK